MVVFAAEILPLIQGFYEGVILGWPAVKSGWEVGCSGRQIDSTAERRGSAEPRRYWLYGHLTGGPPGDRRPGPPLTRCCRQSSCPAAQKLAGQAGQFDAEQQQAAPEAQPDGDQWVPGDAPSLAARWAVEAVAKAGSIGIIGVHSPEFHAYPIGQAMNKNLTLHMGNCNHRRYIPRLLDLVAPASSIPPRSSPRRRSRPQPSTRTRRSNAAGKAG